MKKTENNYLSSTEFVNSLNKYIPSLVLSQWIQKVDANKLVLPELQSTETVVLFADISGFTMISEACASMGVRGNEELAFCINRYMEGMVKSLGKYGGDIIKFVGDAMIVMWPRNIPVSTTDGSNGKGPQFKDQVDDRVTVVRKAIQCALDIQIELNNKKIMSNVTNLSVKIGIGFGDCALLYVGGVFNRAEFFTVGEALTQALNCEECATAGGQIIVSERAWSQVSDFFQSDELKNDHGKKFYKISGMISGIRTRADAVLLRNLIQSDNFTRIQSKLKACVPAAIMPYLEIGYEQYGSETRRITVMFASLGVDLSSAQTLEGMNKIQKIVTTVQQQVYRQEGSLNKLVMDDKGSTLICIWGLCPYAHEDDAARAILTAMNMRKELLKVDNTWCNVGISTGEVFCGVVGTSGSRKEFSVLGDYVNLAARVMYWPKKYKLIGKINVDLNTKKEADNFIKFTYKGHCEFKGKSIALPIFEPIDPQEEAEQCLKKIVPFDTFLKIHSNPFLVDRNSEHKRKQCKQIGRENLLHKVCEDLIDFFDTDNQGRSKPYILAILGEIGSGKTLFARCIINQLTLRKDFLRDDIMGNDQKAILTSSLNCESQMKFLGIWRPILQMMLNIHSRSIKQPIEKIMKRLLSTIKDERLDLILDIFNLQEMKTSGQINLPLPDDPFHFVKREKYSEEIVDGILDFTIEFIKEVLGEKDESYSEGQSQLDEKSQEQQFIFSENPMILVLDTVQLMDEASWKLLELIKDECSQIAIILLVQTDTNNQPKIHPEAKQFYQETFGNHLDLLKIIGLPPFKLEDLSQLVSQLAVKYQNSMQEEIHLMTNIEDPAHTIRNEEVCKQKAKELKKKYMTIDTFKMINDDILKLALERCEGNPMTSLHFLYNLMINEFLVNKDQYLLPTESYLKCAQRSDWSTVPVPSNSLKINSQLLDSFLKEMRAKPNKAEQELAIKGILILKSAAVIGEVFGSKVLQHISPLRHETSKSILQILRVLEAKDFIEILDETDPKNSICRFRKCFLRESIYQIMLYRAQKKGLHQLMVQYSQDNSNQLDNDPDIEADKLLNHILLAEDLDTEEKVPFKSKQGLIVKKIENKMMKFPNSILKQGYMTKQGDKPNKKVEKRLMILTSKDLSWYHNDQEFRKKKPLGVIYLSAVYHCVPANTQKSTDDVNIGTCAWRKKDAEKEGKREFIFGAKDEQERDEWITCIEYLRAKAIYENFVTKYCNINFPIRRNSEDKNVGQRDHLLNEITDFGSKFRNFARFNKLQDELQLSIIQRNSRSSYRRGTKLNSVSNNTITQFNDNSLISQLHNPKDLANKIKNLYNATIVTFVNQVSQNANKQSNSRSDTLKKIPDCLKNTSLFITQDESVDMSGNSINLKHHQSFLQNNSALVQDVSRDEKLKDLRRVSEIARREIFGDDPEVKTYLEDLKGISSISPQQRRGQNHKIIEENEEEQSEEDFSQIQRKSAISDLTAQSQPNQGSTSQNFYATNSDVLRAQSDNSQNQSKLNETSISNNNTNNQEVFNKKSRISIQMEMINGLNKQRELTLGKQINDDHNNNINHNNDLQIFALNVNPTEKVPTPKKNQKIFFKEMDKIEEIDEYKQENKKKSKKESISKNVTPQQQKKKPIVQQEELSSSSEGEVENDEEQDYKEETKLQIQHKKRNTGDFSQMDHSDYQSAPISKIKKPFKSSIEIEKIQNLQKKFSTLTQNPGPIKPNKEVKTKEPIQHQQVEQPQVNITELISQTIQQQVSKSIKQLFNSVQKVSRKTIEQQQTKRDSLQSMNSSSIYDEDWMQQYVSRVQKSGGAASSKKIQMEQAVSKQNSDSRTKKKVRKGRNEDVDDDDFIQDPDESDDSPKKIRHKAKKQTDSFATAGNFRRDNPNKSFTQIDQYSRGGKNHTLVRNPSQLSNNARSVSRGPSSQQHALPNMQQQLMNNYLANQNQSSLLYSQSPLNTQHPLQMGLMNDQSMLSQQQYQQPYMSPPGFNQQYMYPQYSPPYQQQFYDQQQYMAALNQQRYIPDNEFYLFEDQIEGTPQNQFLSEVSSIIADTSDPQHQFAIVIEDVSCQLKGEMMQLYEGDKVEVIKIINDIGMAECKFKNQIGIFPLGMIKFIKRNDNAANDISKQKKKSTLFQETTQLNKQRPTRDTRESRGANNQPTPSQKQQNFFTKPFELQNSQSSSNQSQQTKLLKLQERKKQKLRQQHMQDDESAERLIDSLNY